jgi:GT2 family glycosyltransferase
MSMSVSSSPADVAAEPLALGEEASIAVAAHGNVATTQVCLKSIFQSATGQYELILIDDCSPDSGATRSLFLEAKRRHANTKLFSFSENLEYSGSLNAILSHAGGEWVFFVSNDIFITPFYLRALLEAARANPRIGILRGSSNFVDNGLPTHNLFPPGPLTKLSEIHQAGAEIARLFGHRAESDPFLVGDAFLVTRALLARIGTIDPWFYGYFADQDYGLRARIAGFDLALIRGAFAYHQREANIAYLPESQRKEKLSRRWMRVYENWARFKLKWGLPVPLAYESTTMRTLPWAQLAAAPFDVSRHFIAPANYSRYLI